MRAQSLQEIAFLALKPKQEKLQKLSCKIVHFQKIICVHLRANRSKVDARFSKWTHENDTFREKKNYAAMSHKVVEKQG